MENIIEEKIGVFLARFQPLHNAHLYVIETALKECDKVVIMLGSSNKGGMLRNPYDFRLRYNLLRASLPIEDLDRISIYELPDWSQEDKTEDDRTWGYYLYYNVAARIKQKRFTLYYSDKPDILESWFSEDVRQYIDCRYLDRSSIFEGLSSTKIRAAMLRFNEEDQKYLEKCLPLAAFRRINELRGIWLDIQKNPKNDFTMK